MTPFEGLTSAMGEGLTEINGFQITRLTEAVSSERREQLLVNTLDYTSAQTLTLSAGTFNGTVTPGQRVRILSGPGTAAEAVIQTVVSPTQITLASELLDAAGNSVPFFTGASAEVVNDPATVLPVESTFGFPSTPSFTLDGVGYLGRIVVERQVYYYRGLTSTSFTGLVWDDLGTVRSGVRVNHTPWARVDDFSRATSAVDIYRRSFLLDYAAGEDLTDLAGNFGVQRPDELSDDAIFRALVKGITYAPRGTMYALELALDALLGAGNYELFENLTVGSTSRVGSGVQNRCTVFLAKAADASDANNPNGKFWLDGYEDVPLGTPTVIAPDEARTVASVKLAPETSEVVVAEGTGMSTTDGATLTFPQASIPTYVYPGDILQVTSGPRAGEQATIQTRNDDASLTLGIVVGHPHPGSSLSGSTAGAGWRIFRPESRFGQYLPGDEQILEGGVVRSTTWAYVGGNLATQTATAFDPVLGPHLLLASRTSPPQSAFYRRGIRIRPEDRMVVKAQLDILATNTESAPRQAFVAINDGERVVAAAVTLRAGGLEVEFGLADLVANTLLGGANWSDVPSTIYVPGYNALWLEKNGRGDVQLFRANLSGPSDAVPSVEALRTNRELLETFPYTSFPTIASWTATFASEYTPLAQPELLFGCLTSGAENTSYWKALSWFSTPERDWWNRPLVATTSLGQTINGSFGPADLGRFLTIKDFSAVGSRGGNPLGVWAISAQNGSSATLVGPTYRAGRFTLLDDRIFIVDGDTPFRWPDHANHQLEILTGSNVGVYDIEEVIDTATGRPFSGGPLGTADMASPAARRITGVSNQVRIAAGSSFIVGELNVRWRLVPNFVTDTTIDAEVSGARTESGGVLTFPIPPPFPDGTLLRVYYARVESGYLHDPSEANTLVTASPPEYSVYPAYLYDPFGYVREVADLLTAAGVIADFDSLFRDSSGPHIRS